MKTLSIRKLNIIKKTITDDLGTPKNVRWRFYFQFIYRQRTYRPFSKVLRSHIISVILYKVT